VGRRLFLGLVGAGALGTVLGQSLQSAVGALLEPFTNAGGGGLAALIPGASRFRLYTVTGAFPLINKVPMTWTGTAKG